VMLLLKLLRLKGDEGIYLYSSGSSITPRPRLLISNVLDRAVPHDGPSSTASFPIRPVNVSPSIIPASAIVKRPLQQAHAPWRERDATSPTGNVGVWEDASAASGREG
jgi:hypothetical protein